MNDLITDSVEYPIRSDALLQMMVVGGFIMFVYQLFLRAVLASVTHSGDVVPGSFGDGTSMAALGGLITLGLVSFIVLSGFYVRIAERVIAGEETPPRFSGSEQLVFDGILFCGTLLAIVAVVLAVQLALFVLLVGLVVVVEAVLGVPSIGLVLFTLWLLVVVVPVAIMIVYPQPSIWILIARFRQRREAGASYLRFVASRRFPAELGSILRSRKYMTSWVALVVVSILQGAATIETGSIFAVSQPVDLVIRINSRLVSAIVGFYVSVAVVYLFAFRFREPDRGQQTSFGEFESSPDPAPTKDEPR